MSASTEQVLASVEEDVRASRIKKKLCICCGEKGPHFVPPSLGDEGFYHCILTP